MGLRFTTTRLSGLYAAGRVVEMQHAVIAPALERELGPRHSRFLADFEPEGSDLRAWYAEAAALPRRVADLPPERQVVLRKAAAVMANDIRALADRLAAEGPQKAQLARILAAVATFPEEDLWCDGDQPIVVNWGFAREDRPLAAPRHITGLAPGPPPPSVVGIGAGSVSGAVMAGRLGRVDIRWLTPLLWLLFVLMVAGIDRLLLPVCGIDAPWQLFAGWRAPDTCAAPATAEAAQEGLRLQALVRNAELQLARERRLCTVPSRRAAVGNGTF